MISLKKINNEKVKCIPIGKQEQKPIKGFDLFAEPYANIFLLARKKSGKTTALFNILKKCSDKNTRIIIFSATVSKDANMRSIVKYFKTKHSDIETFTSLIEGKNNVLQNILNELPDPDDDESEKEEKPKIRYISVDDSDEEPTRKRKTKYLAPEIIFVFDDLSTELRNPIVCDLLKTNRHYKCKVILSSQYIHDLVPASIRQLDYLLAFKGLTPDKLALVHKGMDLACDFYLFEKIYKNATEQRYNFLYIDALNQSFRKNFNCAYDVI